jgi:hypothetical protein
MKRGFERQGYCKHRSEILLVLIAGFAVVWFQSAAATEVYTWTDSDGIVHYGDTPPLSGESQKVDVEDAYRPGTASANPPPEKSVQAPSGTDEAVPEEDLRSVAQKRREQIAEDREERREASAESEQMCARYKQRLAQVEPARRVFYTNAKGESIRMDDDMRVDLVEESKEYIAKNCE